MINRIQSSTPFKSRVLLPENAYSRTYGYGYNLASDESNVDKKALQRSISLLEYNGNDDIVSIKPIDDIYGKIAVQVKKNVGDNAYVGYSIVSNCSPESVITAYNEARESVTEVASGPLADYVV